MIMKMSIYHCETAHKLAKLHLNQDVATAALIVCGSKVLTTAQQLTSLKVLYGEEILRKIWEKNIELVIDGTNPPRLEETGKMGGTYSLPTDKKK